MRKLTIYRHYFTDSDCYHEGVRQTSIGVQVHSTGANNPMLKRYVQPDDGRLGINLYGNSHNRPGVDVCASAYIGKLNDGTVAVYQTLHGICAAGSAEKGKMAMQINWDIWALKFARMICKMNSISKRL